LTEPLIACKKFGGNIEVKLDKVGNWINLFENKLPSNKAVIFFLNLNSLILFSLMEEVFSQDYFAEKKSVLI